MSVRALLVFSMALSGCAAFEQMIAGDDDLADYRAFRSAAHEGARLASAQRYVERHPHGQWADEVKAVFEREEAAYYEAAKDSTRAAFEYLVNLPHGPHADAARAIIDTDERALRNAALERVAEESRKMRLMLADARVRRRKVRERILRDVSLLLDPSIYGAAPGLAPAALRAELAGAQTTIAWIAPHREDTLFFEVPTPPAPNEERVPLGKDARAITIDLDLVVAKGVVASGRVSGADMFVLWAEADRAHPLDPNDATARSEAAEHVAALLTGALEATTPTDKCAGRETRQQGRVIFTRSCDGWVVRATMGARGGSSDEIVVERGSRAPGDVLKAP
jgi:hypothetical protein